MEATLKYYLFILLLLCGGCGNSDSAMDIYARGQQEYLNKNLKEAARLFSEVISQDDDFLNAYLMLAKIHYYNKEYDNAFVQIDALLDRDPDHCGGLYWKGRTLLISGRDEKNESENILRSVLEIDSHHIPARLLLALVYEKNGKFKEALHEYIIAMSEEESLISARGNMAVLYRRLGLKERASAEITKAVKIAEITGRDMKSLNLIKSEIEKWEQ
jgi:tetratricopeptide (TPR) repeat protein